MKTLSWMFMDLKTPWSRAVYVSGDLQMKFTFNHSQFRRFRNVCVVLTPPPPFPAHVAEVILNFRLHRVECPSVMDHALQLNSTATTSKCRQYHIRRFEVSAEIHNSHVWMCINNICPRASYLCRCLFMEAVSMTTEIHHVARPPLWM
jgi:hypothetical protein